MTSNNLRGDIKSIILPTFANIFNLFNGSWSISRQIINYKENQFSATVKGIAVFYKQSNTASLLHETVTVNWANHSTSLATKSYLFEQNDDSLLQYRFDIPINLLKTKQLDQTTISKKILMHVLFHQNKPALSSNSLHYCGMDSYELSFAIVSQEVFLMNYRICGPAKNSYITSVYKRI